MDIQYKAFFDQATFTITYCVYDSLTQDAIIIDPVLDYDAASSKYSYNNIKKLVSFLEDNKFELKAVIETHAHADHLTGAEALKHKYPKAYLAIGSNIKRVQREFKSILDLEGLKTDASQFDILFNEGQSYSFGSIDLKCIFTPGHTQACCSYLIEDLLFVGDTIFMPDFGTGRCDFPGGSALELYNSISKKIYVLDENIKVLTGHDYCPGGRSVAYESTIKEQRENNIQLNMTTTLEEFVEFREKRDKTLNAPRLLYPSIQVNVNAGSLPIDPKTGKAFLKLPLYGDKV